MKFIYDNLIEFRLQAGDYYKEMCNAISETYTNWYNKTPDPLVFIKEANYLNLLVYGCPKGNQRNESSVFQLDLINKLQKLNIKLLHESNNKEKRHEILRTFAFNCKLIE